MKFKVSSSALLSHLQLAGKVILPKNAMPILDNFLFTITADTLTVVASDNEVTLSTQVDIFDVEGQGSLAIPAKVLLDPLRDLPEQPLTFEINNNLEIVIYTQNGKYNCMGVNGNDFPLQKESQESDRRFHLPVAVLLAGITRTSFAVGESELRPVMSGIYIDIFPDSINFVASDSHKLVRYTRKNVTMNIEEGFILPRKPATLLKSALAQESEEVEVVISDNKARFIMQNYELNCMLINGRYPNYNAVIPQNNYNKLYIDRALMANVVRRVSAFCSQSASSLIKLTLSNNTLVLSTEDTDFSMSAQESLTCNYAGDAMKIGFKSQLLLEILNNLSSAEILIELADSSRAGLLAPTENAKDEEVLMLLMPMMLSDN